MRDRSVYDKLPCFFVSEVDSGTSVDLWVTLTTPGKIWKSIAGNDGSGILPYRCKSSVALDYRSASQEEGESRPGRVRQILLSHRMSRCGSGALMGFQWLGDWGVLA
ncbi:hypothetical protein AA102526_0151 [Asaia lannensis NBRC 102526]|nr:hypothetical protein AA102526_0151 [Asaia lannensis NBRC 102526]